MSAPKRACNICYKSYPISHFHSAGHGRRHYTCPACIKKRLAVKLPSNTWLRLLGGTTDKHGVDQSLKAKIHRFWEVAVKRGFEAEGHEATDEEITTAVGYCLLARDLSLLNPDFMDELDAVDREPKLGDHYGEAG